MSISKFTLMVIASVALMTTAAACGNKAKKEATTTVRNDGAGARDRGEDRDPAPAPTGSVTGIDQDGSEIRFRPVYFEFDSSELSADARAELARIAEHLVKNKGMAVTVEGHADERGTTEYNLALGERRARTIRDYLVRMGVSESRVAIISYGEERPAATGEGEEAWTQNRRGEFKKR